LGLDGARLNSMFNLPRRVHTMDALQALVVIA